MRQSVLTVPAALPANPEACGHHRCTECPVCGTEECRVYQDLGMACDTAQAARESKGVRRGVRGGGSPGQRVRPGRPKVAP